MPTAVFYHPEPLVEHGRSGSQVRPWEMLRALRATAYDVEVVAGDSAARKTAIRRLLPRISAGEIDLVYAEMSTTPVFLTDSHHLPLRPLIDWRFFSALKRHQVPFGVFYRDLHWRFPHYGVGLGLLKKTVALAAYRLEWRLLHRYADVIFLPSAQMKQYLPGHGHDVRTCALPPGGVIEDLPHSAASAGQGLRLLYIGGITPPLYDLRQYIDVIRETSGVSLTLCCREDEWHRQEELYRARLGSNVHVVHESGPRLRELYRRHDAMLIALDAYDYHRFGQPIKAYQAIGAGVPVLVSRTIDVARTIEGDELGWTFDEPHELRELLEYLRQHPGAIEACRQRVLERRAKHSWSARVDRVITELSSIGRGK